MAACKLDISAQLVISHNADNIVVVADGNYIIANIQDQKALDRLLAGAGGKSDNSEKKPKSSGGGPLKTLNKINDEVRALGLVVEVRVGGKTYVTFGSGKSASISAAAIWGKISSFLGF
ncbi:MAG: hypothetical protein LPK19_11075 [Hymenobacteraceae bacterium]|nr:hypothetical protein [Hymenobacteraceae bacterium]MDX5396775.1 hypothetical protein [Hymenobacteraceae bacterium]MDX5512838.1 hypothetical protein [Hymenobacteraceae bacterium]